MEAMTRHRSHSAAFKRQVAEEFIAGETLHALSKRHDVSRQLIRIWVGKAMSLLFDEHKAAGFTLPPWPAERGQAACEPGLRTGHPSRPGHRTIPAPRSGHPGT